jgi:GTP cyclohydrolase FolE2
MLKFKFQDPGIHYSRICNSVASFMERESCILLHIQLNCISTMCRVLHTQNDYSRTDKHEQIDYSMYLHSLHITIWTFQQKRWKCAIKVVSNQVPAIKSSQIYGVILELDDTCPWSWSFTIQKIKLHFCNNLWKVILTWKVQVI